METPTFLYKPNFCAECGEKIERERWHLWSSRRFCDECEPVYRLNRWLPPALVLVAVFFGGMFFAQMGRKVDKTAPVVATQSALNAEKPAVPARKTPATEQSTNLPTNLQNSAVNAAVNQNKAQNTTTAAPFRSQQTVNSSFSGPVYICGARTQKGTPCSRRVRDAGTRCWQHAGKPSLLEK